MANFRNKLRPPKRDASKWNPVRQVGRWDDESWAEVQLGAKLAGAPNFTAWARKILLREARRIRKLKDSK